jgi:hypothetical protein
MVISPMATKLYVTSIYNGTAFDTSYIYQFDLTSSNILASRQTIYTLLRPSVAGLLQLGPDEKIYLSCSMEFSDCGFSWLYCDTSFYPENMNLCVINQPENLGTACDFQPFSFYLGGHRSYVGLPNNPNYEMQALGGSLCDTLGLPNSIGNVQTALSKSELHVWYNSEWQTAFINANHLQGKHYSMQVFDMPGKVVYSEEGKLSSEFYTNNLNCAAFASGIYTVSLQTEKEKLVQRFVK